MRVATGNAMEHMDFGEYTWHVLNPLNMITDGLLAGLFGGATNYFRLGTAFPSQSMVNAYNASQAALQSVQVARAASQADDAANGTKNSNPSVSEGGSKTIITPEMEEKILLGRRKNPARNELTGGHSPNITNSNPKEALIKTGLW